MPMNPESDKTKDTSEKNDGTSLRESSFVVFGEVSRTSLSLSLLLLLPYSGNG